MDNNEVIFLQDTEPKDESWSTTMAVFLVGVWIILGMLARVWSVVCFGLEGSFHDKWIGFLTAMILGPFYWLFYSFVPSDYCSMSSSKSSSTPPPPSKRKQKSKSPTK